jgi:hypothetical protein
METNFVITKLFIYGVSGVSGVSGVLAIDFVFDFKTYK